MRSIRQRKTACPGTITEHAKFKGPIRDWRSRSVIERLWRNSDSKLWHFCSLSTGRRASIFRKSRVIPVNWSVEKGPILFFCFFCIYKGPKSWISHGNNTLRLQQKIKNHREYAKLQTPYSLVMAIHSKALLKDSKMLQLVEHPFSKA